MQLDDVVVLGRTFAEYCEYFRLPQERIASERILDMGAGVSAFCAEAAAVGCDVTAVDPIYGARAEDIRSKARDDLREVFRQLPGVAHNYNWTFYRNPDELRARREAALARFVRDFSGDRRRYVAASLPDAPFRDNAFTLSLVSHLLFLYEDILDYEFHKAGILELARITAGEIRIYPLTNLKAMRSSFVERLIQDDDCSRLKFEVVRIDFSFVKNSNELLVVRKSK